MTINCHSTPCRNDMISTLEKPLFCKSWLRQISTVPISSARPTAVQCELLLKRNLGACCEGLLNQHEVKCRKIFPLVKVALAPLIPRRWRRLRSGRRCPIVYVRKVPMSYIRMYNSNGGKILVEIRQTARSSCY